MPMSGGSLVCGSNKVVAGVSVRIAASGLSGGFSPVCPGVFLVALPLSPPMGCLVAVSDLSAHSSIPLGVGEKALQPLPLSLF